MRTRKFPQVQSGSVADIAFLLLIFFLVTTVIETDQGVYRKLPDPELQSEMEVNERNLLRIDLNDSGLLLVRGELTLPDSLLSISTRFIDNGGAHRETQDFCEYCGGDRLPGYSDHPQKAVIQIAYLRETPYQYYIAVQDRLSKAYHHLRNREGMKRFGMSYTEMIKRLNNPEIPEEPRAELIFRTELLKELYPMQIIEDYQ
jgi:hypothetical protein